MLRPGYLGPMQRKSIDFTGNALQALSPFFGNTAERLALEDLVGEPLASESHVLRALVTLGAQAARNHQLEMGYSAWAAGWTEADEAWSAASAAVIATRVNDDR